ncbi:DUF4097 family beta strand repeat-containing protein [Streptomyces sp. NPDC048001]|uniref:DUF4097 family beta strand repeat-containing protein n=1 Tax=Streptomyces sp. NPDC048001 TaxID=3365498 RepID=UPI0037111CD8
MQTFDTPAPISAVLDVPAGTIRLVAEDRTDTTVEVLPADAARSRDVRAAREIRVAYRDGVLRIAAPEARKRPLGHSGAVEVAVRLPAGSHVEAATAAVGLRGVGRLGTVAFHGAQGEVRLDEAGDARLAVQDGDIVVGRLTGSAEISSSRGNLTVDEAERGTVTLRTAQGDISVGAARGTSAALDAGTSSGRIRNALGNAEGAPDLTIHATTQQGDITARSL